MPEKTGRTGRPGNQTSYRPIKIRTPHPEKLMGGMKAAPSAKEVIGGTFPGRQAGKYTLKAKNTGKKNR